MIVLIQMCKKTRSTMIMVKLMLKTILTPFLRLSGWHMTIATLG